MRRAGDVVRIYYDSRRDVDAGDILFTPTGRCYRIVAARQQQTGKHAGRWHLTCVVLAGHVDEQPRDGERRLPIIWYRRERKRP